MTIIIIYRPSLGAMSSIAEPIFLDENREWRSKATGAGFLGNQKNTYSLEFAIKSINENSFHKHNILVGIDSDMEVPNSFLKEFGNVKIFKSSYVCNETEAKAHHRSSNVTREMINSLPDDEMICYNWITDLMAIKDWDKYIYEAIEKYGKEGYVYAPSWIEVIKGLKDDITFENIWVKWRERCCHALSFPLADNGIITQSEIDNYVSIAKGFNNGIIIENTNDRIYGYYNAICVLNEKAKKNMVKLGYHWEILFDNNFSLGLGMKKCVVTNSFVIHIDKGAYKEDL